MQIKYSVCFPQSKWEIIKFMRYQIECPECPASVLGQYQMQAICCFSPAQQGNGTPLQYSCLENPKDRGAWWATVHGVAKSWRQLRTSLSLFTFMHWRRKWQPTPVFFSGEFQGRGAWWATIYGVAQSQTLKRLSSSSSNKA